MEANKRHFCVIPVRYTLIAVRLLIHVVGIVAALAVLWQGTRLVFRADPRDDLRRGDTLFVAGRYHNALQIYTSLTARAPTFAAGWARRSMIETIRGETTLADRSLATALQLGLHDDDHDLARLYQGFLATHTGRASEAASAWATLGDHAPLRSLERVLEAEQQLHAGDYAGAEVRFRAALADKLPDAWRALVQRRLAALRAASDPAAALAILTTADRRPPTGAGSWWLLAPNQTAVTALAMPLLPSAAPSEAALLGALRADPAQRPQLLGQVYLDSGLYPLAEAQFSLAATDTRRARDAAAYAAYTRWRAGDTSGGVQRLEALVAAHPDDARARALLAVTYVANADPTRAQTQLAAMRALAPHDSDTHLAWGQWYTAQHDYLAAADAYQRALSDAPVEQRGTYALALARFSLDTDVQTCAAGTLAAQEATVQLPRDPLTWATLAGIQYHCGDADAARAAAQQALARDSNSPEAAYYLGRALAALGDRSGARAALVSAADLAPASAWRERAEKQMALLGL